jgi:type II secretory pathway component PulF
VPPAWAGWGAAVLGSAVLALFYGWSRSSRGRPPLRLAGRLPFLRRIAELATAEETLRVVAAHVATGSTLARALEAAGLERAAQAVLAGEPAAAAWAATPLPAFARARAAAGSAHEGLALATALEALADDCAARLERRVARATAWLQPAALLVTGGLLALQFAAVVAWYDGVRREVELW